MQRHCSLPPLLSSLLPSLRPSPLPSLRPSLLSSLQRPSRHFGLAGLFTLVLLANPLANTALAQGKTQLLVYTALETDQLKDYQEGFNKAYPNIELKWVRDSTGVITAKLLAEKANPQADAVMGVAASSLALLDRNGMLEPYKPLNLDAIMSSYRDKKNPPAWFGMDVWGATVCFNTVEAAKKGIPKPDSWKDLTKPVYKGQVVMPNPASSGTGFFDVTAWLTLWGDDNGRGGGWQYMDALHQNIGQYTHSGSKPCNMAASGEYVVGISFEYRGNANKAKGAPIDLIFPKEGLGWDLEAFAIHKGTKKLAAAQKLADWASSKDAMLLYGKNFAITAQPGVAAPLANVPQDYEARLVKMDFDATAASRERVLAEWNKRYSTKSEAKK
jgi:iron(III) transport system substrate-binding protein